MELGHGGPVLGKPLRTKRQEDLELKASLGYLVWSSQEERCLNETPITSANEESRYFSQLPQVCSSSSIYIQFQGSIYLQFENEGLANIDIFLEAILLVGRCHLTETLKQCFPHYNQTIMNIYCKDIVSMEIHSILNKILSILYLD